MSRVLVLGGSHAGKFAPDHGSFIEMLNIDHRELLVSDPADPGWPKSLRSTYERQSFHIGGGIVRPVYLPIGTHKEEADARVGVWLADLWDKAEKGYRR